VLEGKLRGRVGLRSDDREGYFTFPDRILLVICSAWNKTWLSGHFQGRGSVIRRLTPELAVEQGTKQV